MFFSLAQTTPFINCILQEQHRFKRSEFIRVREPIQEGWVRGFSFEILSSKFVFLFGSNGVVYQLHFVCFSLWVKRRFELCRLLEPNVRLKPNVQDNCVILSLFGQKKKTCQQDDMAINTKN